MAVVVLQLGQGGNQFGFSFFEALSALKPSRSLPIEFFRESTKADTPATARTVLIDMEPKVVAAVKSRANARGRSWRYGPQSSFTQDSGSGNNWARGFCRHGPRCADELLNLIRREVENCDSFGGFVSMQSIAGGTGAGLGAYLLEILKDEFPSSCIVSYCIWPLDGEVIVQCYNTLLSLAHLQNMADGLILVRNEELMATCKRLLGIQRPSFEDMNQMGARRLASIFLPAYFRQAETFCSQRSKRVAASDIISSAGPRIRLLSDILSLLCPHPKYRMLALRSTPQVPTNMINFTTFSWQSNLKQLARMLYMQQPSDRPEAAPLESHNSNAFLRVKTSTMTNRSVDRCLANLLVLRGRASMEADVSLLRDEALYPIWSVDPLTVAAHQTTLGRYDKTATLLSNCQSAIAPAYHALSRAYSMYSAKAYLFHYFDHGLNREFFDACFATLDDILACYRAL